MIWGSVETGNLTDCVHTATFRKVNSLKPWRALPQPSWMATKGLTCSIVVPSLVDIDLRNGFVVTMETLIVAWVTLFVPGTGPVPCKKVSAHSALVVRPVVLDDLMPLLILSCGGL
jgi:hypothetical protein